MEFSRLFTYRYHQAIKDRNVAMAEARGLRLMIPFAVSAGALELRVMQKAATARTKNHMALRERKNAIQYEGIDPAIS